MELKTDHDSIFGATLEEVMRLQKVYIIINVVIFRLNGTARAVSPHATS